MKYSKLCACIFLIALLSGCTSQRTSNDIRRHMVTQVKILCYGNNDHSQRFYEDSGKIRILLLAIRTLGPDFPAEENVDALSGKCICIYLHCADGSKTVYRIKNNQYLQKNDGSWRKIDFDKCAGFWQLILLLPPDQEAVYSSENARRIYFPVLRNIGQ